MWVRLFVLYLLLINDDGDDDDNDDKDFFDLEAFLKSSIHLKRNKNKNKLLRGEKSNPTCLTHHLRLIVYRLEHS